MCKLAAVPSVCGHIVLSGLTPSYFFTVIVESPNFHTKAQKLHESCNEPVMLKNRDHTEYIGSLLGSSMCYYEGHIVVSTWLLTTWNS